VFDSDQVPAPIAQLITPVRDLSNDPQLPSTTPQQRAGTLAGLRQLVHAAEAAFLTTLAEFDANGDGDILHGAQSTASWLRGALGMAPGDAAERVRIARSSRHLLAEPVCLMRDGCLSYDQVRAIHQHTASLPELCQAEATQILTDLAQQSDVTAVRAAGHKIRATLDPDGTLAASEKDFGRRHLTLSPLLDGMTDLHGLLDPEAATALTAALAPHLTPTGPDDHRTPAQRRADGLVDVVTTAMATGQLRTSGGQPTHLNILIPAAGPAELTDSPTPNKYLTEPTLDRLACDSTRTAILVDQKGTPLDVGRTKRLFTPTQRAALTLRDAGCRFPLCNRPAAHTDAHHITPWTDGGHTDLDNALLLCRHHHRAVHEGCWTISATPDGGNGPTTFINPHTQTAHTTFPRGP
jgi:Domain of unknown function (DUF222)/HNH endonuclease